MSYLSISPNLHKTFKYPYYFTRSFTKIGGIIFLAHLPAGYITSKIFEKKLQREISSRKILFIALIGSIAPDLDLFYFYLISERALPHHAYLSHIPLFWITIFSLLLVSNSIRFSKERLLLSSIFIINVFVHLILDTVVGGIMWLSPMSNRYISLFSINARYNWWVLNYILNWTFLFEVLIISSALFVYLNDRLKKKGRSLCLESSIHLDHFQD